MMKHENEWPSNWYWSREDLLILRDMFEPPYPFGEYNTDESLRHMNNDPLPWEQVSAYTSVVFALTRQCAGLGSRKGHITMYDENTLAAIFNMLDQISYGQINNNIPATDPEYARAMMIVLDNVERCHPIGEA